MGLTNAENVRKWRANNTDKAKSQNRLARTRYYHWKKITLSLGNIDQTLFH